MEVHPGGGFRPDRIRCPVWRIVVHDQDVHVMRDGAELLLQRLDHQDDVFPLLIGWKDNDNLHGSPAGVNDLYDRKERLMALLAFRIAAYTAAGLSSPTCSCLSAMNVTSRYAAKQTAMSGDSQLVPACGVSMRS